MLKSVCEGNPELGAYILSFVPSEKIGNSPITYHAHMQNWQKALGYNDLYDEGFQLGSHMDRLKLYFGPENQPDKYVIWGWKGYYWNLGAGAEIGVYEHDRNVNGIRGTIDHYDVSPIPSYLPMSIYLFSGQNYNNILS